MNNTKKIIYISSYFGPHNSIASIRSTKIAKFLAKNHNCNICVITAKNDNYIKDGLLERDLSYIGRIIEIEINNRVINFLNYLLNGRILSRNRIIHSIPFLKGFFSYLFQIFESLIYFYETKKKLKNEKIEYDTIISSYAPFSSHYIGRYLKKKCKNAFWIADFRDPVINWTTPVLLRSFAKNFVDKVCKSADLIITVSEGVANKLSVSGNKKIQIISNGFDRNDIPILKAKPDFEKFRIGYFGQIYKNRQDLTSFFRVLHSLIEDGVIDRNKIEINYAGQTPDRFQKQLESFFLLKNKLVIHGFLPREESILLQSQMDLLLIASWNYTDSNGIVTGKLLEYLMVGRPILAIVIGNLPNSKVKEIIRKTKTGFCYENTTHDRDYKEMYDFIERKYKDKDYKKFNISTNQIEISEYDYEKITKKIFKAIL